jgi:histidine triad (HIT) family protein
VTLIIPDLSPCPFCEYLTGAAECTFLNRGALVSAFLNITQYERGATLVVPNTHVETIVTATEEQVAAVHVEARRIAAILVRRLGATGVNVFQNNGRASGQTVPHYHVHVVPRYVGSDPARRFREADFEQTPQEELRMLAATLLAPGRS